MPWWGGWGPFTRARGAAQCRRETEAGQHPDILVGWRGMDQTCCRLFKTHLIPLQGARGGGSLPAPGMQLRPQGHIQHPYPLPRQDTHIRPSLGPPPTSVCTPRDRHRCIRSSQAYWCWSCPGAGVGVASSPLPALGAPTPAVPAPLAPMEGRPRPSGDSRGVQTPPSAAGVVAAHSQLSHTGRSLGELGVGHEEAMCPLKKRELL